MESGEFTQKILNKLCIEQLNEMQQHTVEAILGSDGDVVILSPTGSGKTLAYLLPLIQLINGQWSMDNGQWPIALVITPGRELALQSHQVLQSMGCGIRSTACYGGRAAMEEHKVLKEVKPQIVFGTPGRLNDHLSKENISRSSIHYLVIDEGTLIDFLPEEEQTSERVTLYEVHSAEKDKLGTLKQLLLSFGNESSIVFLNYRNAVERVSNYLKDEGFTISSFHGGLEQHQREEQLYRFSNGSANVLVATDLASRGLDIPDIQNIIHYHLPESEEGYIHRVGRTARWNATGRAFFILNSDEHIPEYVNGQWSMFNVQCSTVNVPAPPKNATLYIGKGKKDKISKGDIVGFLCKIGGLKADEIGRIDVKDRYTYVAVKREKLKQVLRQTQGEKVKGVKTIIEPVR